MMINKHLCNKRYVVALSVAYMWANMKLTSIKYIKNIISTYNTFINIRHIRYMIVYWLVQKKQ